METSAKSRWQIRIAVLAIFVVGFIAGSLAMNAYHTRRGQPFLAAGGRGGYARVFDQLDLNADQRTKVDQIFNDARARLVEIRKDNAPKFKEVRQQTDDRLKEVLTPDQWDQFQKLTSDMKRHRGRHGSDTKSE